MKKMKLVAIILLSVALVSAWFFVSNKIEKTHDEVVKDLMRSGAIDFAVKKIRQQHPDYKRNKIQVCYKCRIKRYKLKDNAVEYMFYLSVDDKPHSDHVLVGVRSANKNLSITYMEIDNPIGN
jgi:PP-loop superfamily ATP-utilizing enzyme